VLQRYFRALADFSVRVKKYQQHIFVRVRDSFILADFVVMDIEGNLGVDLFLGRPFLRSAKARIDVGRGEIHFRVGKEDMFFRFKRRKEHRFSFMMQQDSKGQALWVALELQPEHQPSTPKWKKESKDGVAEGRKFGLVQFSRTSRPVVSMVEKSRARRTINDAPLPKVNWYLSHICFLRLFNLFSAHLFFSLHD